MSSNTTRVREAADTARSDDLTAFVVRVLREVAAELGVRVPDDCRDRARHREHLELLRTRKREADL